MQTNGISRFITKKLIERKWNFLMDEHFHKDKN